MGRNDDAVDALADELIAEGEASKACFVYEVNSAVGRLTSADM